jgi:sorting nexin-25
VIEVKRAAGDQMPAAAWVVARRYSEFHELNKKLRVKYPEIRHLEFPRRHAVMSMQKDVLQKRKVQLERWLGELLRVPAICRSRELRSFLSQQALRSTDGQSEQAQERDFVTRIYNSVTDGMEEFLGNIPVLDQLSLAGQNLISAATSQIQAGGPASGTNDGASISNSSSSANLNTIPASTTVPLDPTTEAELAALDASTSVQDATFIKPIADLFLELFSLNTDGNWLRGRAVVVVLHQLLGGTIERKVREQAKTLTTEDSVAKYLSMLKDVMWPGGVLKKMEDRSIPQREASRKEAAVILGLLVPELAGSVVGTRNATSAARRIAAVANNERLK